MQLLVLGCGASAGVPRLGGPDGRGDWGLCDPANPRNRRRRVSVLVCHGDIRLLVDTGPDLRDQLLDHGIGWISAVLYTHDHADHSHGIDDLRPLYHANGHRIDCYMDRPTRAGLRTRFTYAFAGRAGYAPTVRAHLVSPDMRFGELVVRPFRQAHGEVQSLGFRFEAGGHAIAYSTDLSAIPDESWPLLAGLDLWVVDALRHEPHPTHSHVAQTCEWIERAAPREAWLTHMDNSLDHDALACALPAGVSPAYDGRLWTGGAS